MSQNAPLELNTKVEWGDGSIAGGPGPPYHLGDEVVLTCDPGFTRPQTFKATVILENGVLRWEPARLACIPVRCPDPPFVDHGRPNQTLFTYLSAFHYVCDEGYVLRGSNATHWCMPSGQWQPTPSLHVRCDPVECPELQAPANGTLDITDRWFGSVARYRCDPYILRGDRERTCQKDGTWSGEAPTCEPPTCPEMDPAVNVVLRAGNIHYVDCGQGLTVPVKCLPTGQWSRPHPYCPGGNPIAANPPAVVANPPVAVANPPIVAPVQKDPTSPFKLTFPKIAFVFCFLLLVLSFCLR